MPAEGCLALNWERTIPSVRTRDVQLPSTLHSMAICGENRRMPHSREDMPTLDHINACDVLAKPLPAASMNAVAPYRASDDSG